jgi:anti-sigma factor RsiW
MTNDKQRQQMHEALDATLKPDAYRDLMRDVQHDAESAREYEELRSVDGALKEAPLPTEPVPRRLAANIMAKIADAKTLPVAQPLKSGRALAVGLVLGGLAGFGLLVLLSWGLLAAFGTGTALSGLALGVVGLAVAVYSALTAAGTLVANNPLIFLALLLIPLAAFGLHRTRPPMQDGERDV